MRPLRKLCRELGVVATFEPIETRTAARDGWPAGSRHFVATLKFQGRELQTEYSIGSAVKEPVLEDLVACVLSDASCGRDTFEDYCGNFGLDTDSRKAHDTWLACVAIACDVSALFGLHLETFEQAAADW